MAIEREVTKDVLRQMSESRNAQPAGGPANEVPGDPWKHRSSGMTCATCMWYVEKAPTGQRTRILGRCRRHAPTMNGYPVVFPADWCGDHKLDETKA
jgi:hypothetical protein